MASYRVSGPTGPSSNITLDSIQPILGLQPSGNTDSILGGVGLYIFSSQDGTYNKGYWVPYRVYHTGV